MVEPPSPPKPPPDPPEVLARLRDGLDLVDMLARQLRRQFGPYVQVDDLTSQGREALDRARDERDSPEEAVANAELLARIRAAIAERPEAERRLLERHYFEDVNFEETARELGLSKSWASRLHSRAIEGIAKALKRGGIDA
jgi:RNA polymerase sigma factor (sigma-70 family)